MIEFVQRHLRSRAFWASFPIMNGMSLINTAIVIFAGSALLLNDSNIRGAVALDWSRHEFSQQYYPAHHQIAASWGQLQLAFTGADQFEMFDASEEIRPENAPAFTELRMPLRDQACRLLLCRRVKPILKDVSILAPRGQDDSCCPSYWIQWDDYYEYSIVLWCG